MPPTLKMFFLSGFGERMSGVCKGMRSDTEEGVAKGCKARITIPKVLQMVWASSRR